MGTGAQHPNGAGCAGDEETPPASSCNAGSGEGCFSIAAVRMLEPSLSCAGSHPGLLLWDQGEPLHLSVPSPGTASLGAGAGRSHGRGERDSSCGAPTRCFLDPCSPSLFSIPACLPMYIKKINIYFSQPAPASLPLPVCTSPWAGARGLLP